MVTHEDILAVVLLQNSGGYCYIETVEGKKGYWVHIQEDPPSLDFLIKKWNVTLSKTTSVVYYVPIIQLSSKASSFTFFSNYDAENS